MRGVPVRHGGLRRCIFTGGAVTVSAAAVPGIETTQDIGTYFTGYGFDTDLASAAVDKVKIPKKWDDSFTAFNQIVTGKRPGSGRLQG